MAMWDVIGKATRQPLYRLLGGAVRKRIELAACMGIRPYDEAKAIARGYVEQGFTTLKTKAGRHAEEDLEMVRGIRDGVGDRLKLRIDPNMGYDAGRRLCRWPAIWKNITSNTSSSRCRLAASANRPGCGV